MADYTNKIFELVKQNGFIKSGFTVKDSDFFLVCALPYGNQRRQVCENKTKKYGVIAPFACFNYYYEAVTRLKKISAALREISGGKKEDFRIFCNSRIAEKPLAQSAGVGRLGKNNLVITQEAGSLVVLAALRFPAALAEHIDNKYIYRFDQEQEQQQMEYDNFVYCKNCNAQNPPCAAACPTGALNAQGKIDLKKCIQWYASGNGEIVPDIVLQNWGNVFYGCTKCHDCCPHNKPAIHGITTSLGALDPFVDVENFLTLSDQEIKLRFKGTAMGLSWLSPGALRRNAQCVLGATVKNFYAS